MELHCNQSFAPTFRPIWSHVQALFQGRRSQGCAGNAPLQSSGKVGSAWAPCNCLHSPSPCRSDFRAAALLPTQDAGLLFPQGRREARPAVCSLVVIFNGSQNAGRPVPLGHAWAALPPCADGLDNLFEGAYEAEMPCWQTAATERRRRKDTEHGGGEESRAKARRWKHELCMGISRCCSPGRGRRSAVLPPESPCPRVPGLPGPAPRGGP